MDKNKMIGVVVVVGLVAALYFLVFKGDAAPDYAGAADAAACTDLGGEWTDAVGVEGEADYAAATCAAPAPDYAGAADAAACTDLGGKWTDAVEDDPDTTENEAAAGSCAAE